MADVGNVHCSGSAPASPTERFPSAVRADDNDGTVTLSPCHLVTLSQVVRRYGTPTYAYDIGRIREQVARLRAHLPSALELLYSLKANASLGLCGVLADSGLGADVASAGELVIAVEAGFPPARIFLTGPDKSPAVLAQLQDLPQVIVSLDSVSELPLLASQRRRHTALLRLRPGFRARATCSPGPDSRFGLSFDDLASCKDSLDRPGIEVVGFHVFSRSQVLAVERVLDHLRHGVDLAL